MNSLLHRIIPALLSLTLPLSLQANEVDETDMQNLASTTQQASDLAAQESGATAEDATTTTVDAVEVDTTAVETAEPAIEAIAEQPEPVATTITIATFEIEGNLLLPVELIEQKLQRFIGEGKSRDDLFSIRHAIIKLYRSRDLDGVAVAIPTTGEAGTVMVKIFEDDIDAYPQQAAAQTATEDLAATAPPSEPAPAAKAAKAKAVTPTGPQTYAIKLAPTEKPAVVVIPEPEPELTAEAESAAPADAPENSASVENLLAANESAETAAAEIKEPITQNATPEAVVNSDAKKATVASSPSPEVEAADTAVDTTAPIEKTKAVAKAAAKPELKTTAKAASPEVAKAKVATAKEKAAENIANARAEKAKAARAKIEKVKAEKAKAALAKADATKETTDEVIVATPALDAQQGTFNISSFAVYGNSLVTNEAIENVLQAYIGSGKSHADLVEAKEKISKLYLAKGHRMVAVGIPARIFSEVVPIRIYEAKRRRATDLSIN